MKAGRELDKLIAEEVLDIAVYPGYKVVSIAETLGDSTEAGPANRDLPHYSTDIAAAWQVVEHINNFADEEIYKQFHDYLDNHVGKLQGYRAQDVANYICQAALYAVREHASNPES